MFLLIVNWYHEQAEISTLILLLNIYTLIACIFEGLSVAISTQVGVNITFQANVAYRYACVGYVFGGAVLIVINGGLYYFGSGWINLLTDGDQTVLKEVIELSPLLLVFLTLQASITMMIAVLRGAGKLSTGSVATCFMISVGLFLSNLLGHKEHYREVQTALEWMRLDKLAGIHG